MKITDAAVEAAADAILSTENGMQNDWDVSDREWYEKTARAALKAACRVLVDEYFPEEEDVEWVYACEAAAETIIAISGVNGG